MSAKTVSLLVGIIVFISALGIGFYAHQDAFSNPYIFNDDTRQHIWWMYQFQDGELFNEDLIATYARSLQPWGLILLYKILAVFMDLLLASKFVTIFLLALATLFLYKLTEYITKNHFCGIAAALIFVLSGYTLNRISGGHARAFAYPLLFSFLYYLIKKNYMQCALVMILQCLFYPVIFILAVPTFFLSFFSIRFKRISLDSSRKKIIYFLLGTFAGGILLLAKQHTFNDPEIGTFVTRKQMIEDPAFHDGGRSPKIPTPSLKPKIIKGLLEEGMALKRILKEHPHLKNMSENVSYVISNTFFYLFLLAFLFLALFKKKPLPKEIIYLLVSSIIVFHLSKIVMPKLYFPERYIRYSITPVGILFFASVLRFFFLWIEKIKFPPARKILLPVIKTGLIVLIVFGMWDQNKNTGLKNASLYSDLFIYLKKLPKNTLIAAHPKLASTIPLMTQRSVFLSYELSQPFFTTYWKTIKKRTNDLLKAYYAENPQDIYDFCQENSIDYLVVEPALFTQEYIHNNRFYFEPFQSVVKKILDTSKKPVLAHFPDKCKLFTSSYNYVIEKTSLLEFQEKYIKNIQEITETIEHNSQNGSLVIACNGVEQSLDTLNKSQEEIELVTSTSITNNPEQDILFIVALEDQKKLDLPEFPHHTIVKTTVFPDSSLTLITLKREISPSVSCNIDSTKTQPVFSIKIKNNNDFRQLVPLMLEVTSGNNTGSDFHIVEIQANEQKDYSTQVDIFPKGSIKYSGYLAQPVFTFTPDLASFQHSCGTRIFDDKHVTENAIEAVQNKTPAGFLAYGPYTQFEQGDYIAAFYLSTGKADPESTVGHLDVASAGGDRVFAAKTLQKKDFPTVNTYQLFVLPFSLKNSENLELRVRYDATASMKYGGIFIFKDDQNEIIRTGIKLFDGEKQLYE